MKPRKNYQRLPQPTSEELREFCLGLLRRKFYTEPGDEKHFAQDRIPLLKRVVLYPAAWLDKKGVTIHGDAYRELFSKVFLQAAANVQSKVKYRPAYLAHVIQRHLDLHGEEYYEDAKSVRNLAEHALLIAGQATVAAPDPVRELAAAHKILTSLKPKKTASKPAFKTQLNLFA